MMICMTNNQPEETAGIFLSLCCNHFSYEQFMLRNVKIPPWWNVISIPALTQHHHEVRNFSETSQSMQELHKPSVNRFASPFPDKKRINPADYMPSLYICFSSSISTGDIKVFKTEADNDMAFSVLRHHHSRHLCITACTNCINLSGNFLNDCRRLLDLLRPWLPHLICPAKAATKITNHDYLHSTLASTVTFITFYIATMITFNTL